MSLSLNAPLYSGDHAIKSGLDHLLIQRFTSRNDCFAQMSKIPWLLITLHVPVLLYFILKNHSFSVVFIFKSKFAMDRPTIKVKITEVS